MNVEQFTWVKPEHKRIMFRYLREWRDPDLIIGRNYIPYLYRWHLAPKNNDANVYLHLQVGDDPDDNLHDHPWINTSVILANGYVEVMESAVVERKPGDVVVRQAKTPHRLMLRNNRYSISLFTTGPRIREWGFWVNGGWVPWRDFIEYRDGWSQRKQKAPSEG